MEEINRKIVEQTFIPIGANFVKNLLEESWTYIKTVVDIVHEPILILDKNLCVKAANDPFYRTFQVDAKETEGKVVYELGNGQWNIPNLRKLLEEILPKNSFFKGFEVSHDFPSIGHKVMLLNARQIHFKTDSASKIFPPIILLAMEDITEMMGVAELLTRHTNEFETKMSKRSENLETRIEKLQNEITVLRNGSKKK